MDTGKVTALKKERGTAKGRFTRKVSLFRDRHTKGDPLDVLEAIHSEVVSAYKLLEEKCENVITFYEDNNEEQETDGARKYLFDCDSERCEVLRLLSVAKSGTAIASGGSCQLKVEALKPPRFEGDFRKYPSFKDDFANIIVSKYGKNPFALRQCLGEKPLKVILGCEKDYEEMFKKLDKEYGEPRKLVDLVISDLKSLKVIREGDDRGFVGMINVIERCYLDLQKVNLEKEMNSVSTVSMIERLLPRTQKREWVMTADKLSDKDELFPELLKFLLCEKRVIEYAESSVRNLKSENSNVCNAISQEVDDPNLYDIVKRVQEDQRSMQRTLEEMRVQFSSNAISASRRTVGKGCWLHEFEGHDINGCGKFRSLNSIERLEMTKRKGECFRCLNGKHFARLCRSGLVCDAKDGDGNVCGRSHHPLLHASFTNNEVSANSGSCKGNKAMLCISTINSNCQPLTVLWDSGSDVTLITHCMARKLHAEGRDIMMSMVKVGNVMERCASKEYTIKIYDNAGVEYELKAIGMDEISAQAPHVDLSLLPNIFPDIDMGMIRPSGKIDMLIGIDYCELFPQVIRADGKLQLLENNFGYCVRGSHPLLQMESSNANQVTATVNKAVVDVYQTSLSVEESDSLKESLDGFFKLDTMGTECNPRCISCLCKKCPGGGNLSAKEEYELALIERGLCYNEKEKGWKASYPWVKDPIMLPNNFKAAVARLESTERRLNRLGSEYAVAYGSEITDMVRRNVAVRLKNEEIEGYEGPVHFIPHHEVLKPGSCSTPVRIVFDSSSSYLGHRLNDYWAKGPNMLNNLLGILFRFRED